MYKCVFTIAILFCSLLSFGQSAAPARCATDTRLQKKLNTSAQLRTQFEAARKTFARSVQQQIQAKSLLRQGPATYTIPVVFHIVLSNPASVTDAQINDQLTQLNTCFAAENDQSAPAGLLSAWHNAYRIMCRAQASFVIPVRTALSIPMATT